MPKNAPQVKDPEMSRAFDYVYKDINELLRAVNGVSSKVNRQESKGTDGDLRLYRDLRTKQYFLEGRFNDGWAQVELSTSLKKNTVGSTGGGSGVQSDWNQSNSGSDDFIKNKPNVEYTSAIASMGSANSYAAGLTPVGNATHGDTYLRKDGAWGTPLNTVYSHPNHTGDVTSSGDGATTIATDAVTYAKMQNVASDERILGRVSGADGIIEELTKAQVLTMLNVADGADTGTYNVTHTGEVTGATALTIADDIVDEANLKISNAGTNGQFLSKQSGNTGGLTWATADNYQYFTVDAYYSSSSHVSTINGTADTIQFKAGTGASLSHSATATDVVIQYALDLGTVNLSNIADVKSGNTTLGTSAGNVGKFLRVTDQGGSSYFWDAVVIQNGDISSAMVTQHEDDIDHDALTNFLSAEHVDWASASAGTIHSTNYTDTVDMGDGFRFVYIDDNVQVTENKYLKLKTLNSGSHGFGDLLSGDGSSGNPWIITLNTPNTTYSVMGSGNSYAAGLVPAGANTTTTFLRKDGTWAAVPGVYLQDDDGSGSGDQVQLRSGEYFKIIGSGGITTNWTTHDAGSASGTPNVLTITSSNTGTVTTIATSGAITGGTITTSGTITHSTAAGYTHVPTTYNHGGKFLKAGSNSGGSEAWALITEADVSDLGSYITSTQANAAYLPKSNPTVTSSTDLTLTGVQIVANTSPDAGAGVGGAGEALLSYASGGGVYWGTPTSGPAGSDEQVQYNNNGAMGAEANFKWEYAENNLAIDGTIGTTGNINLPVGALVNFGDTSGSTDRMLIRKNDDSSGEINVLDARSLILRTSDTTKFEIVGSSSYIHMAGGSDVRLTLGSQGTAGTNDSNWVRGNGTSLSFNSASGNYAWEIGGATKMTLGSDLSIWGDFFLETSGQTKWGIDNDGGAFRIYRSGTGSAIDISTSLNTTFSGTITATGEHHYLNNTGGNSNLYIKASNSGHSRLYFGDVADAGVGFIDYDHGTSMTIGAGGAVGLTLAEANNNATFTGNIIATSGITQFKSGSTHTGYIGDGTNMAYAGLGSNDLVIRGADSIGFTTNDGGMDCLELNSSGNATFAANVTVAGYAEIGNGIASVENDGSWHGRLNIAGNNHGRLDVKTNNDGIIGSIWAHDGHGAARFGTTSNHSLILMTHTAVSLTIDTSHNIQLEGYLNVKSDGEGARLGGHNGGFEVRSTKSTDCGIYGSNNSGDFRYQLYAYNGTVYGFLSSNWGNWDLKKDVGGNLTLNNNTSFYLNPASETHLNTLHIEGNLGIGTQSPARTLHLFDSSRVDIRFDGGGSWENHYIRKDGHYLRFRGNDDSTILFELRNNNLGGNECSFPSANLGVGLDDPAYKLHVSGQIYATSNITAYSDIRIKKDIETIDNALDKVMLMRGVYYRRKDEGEDTSGVKVGQRCVGLIAQELQGVLPEVVNYSSRGDFYSVDYGKTVSVLIEAIKELKSEINELKGIA